MILVSGFFQCNIFLPWYIAKLGVHDMQQASHKAEPGDYKDAVNDI